MDGGGVVVRDVRHRRDHPADPVSAGFQSLWAGLLCGGIGLLIAGGVAARLHPQANVVRVVRQLAFGAIAIAATYLVGSLVDTVL